MKPRVWNRRARNVPPDAIYVGRPSPWGNPYSWKVGALAEFVVPRDEVLPAYESWLRGQPELLARVRQELRGKDLVCWCAPRPCHGDILLRIANEEPAPTSAPPARS